MRALWIVLALAGTASAGTPKPPADQAKQTAEAWLEAVRVIRVRVEHGRWSVL